MLEIQSVIAQSWRKRKVSAEPPHAQSRRNLSTLFRIVISNRSRLDGIPVLLLGNRKQDSDRTSTPAILAARLPDCHLSIPYLFPISTLVS